MDEGIYDVEAPLRIDSASAVCRSHTEDARRVSDDRSPLDLEDAVAHDGNTSARSLGEIVLDPALQTSDAVALHSNDLVAPKSRATSGAGFWAKAAMQAGVKRTGLLQKERKSRRLVDFKLDPVHPGAIIDIRQAAE